MCQTCSGAHRSFSHRVKSVSHNVFGDAEIKALQAAGNDAARRTYLAKWREHLLPRPNPSDVASISNFIKEVFVEQKFFAAEAAASTAPSSSASGFDSFTPGRSASFSEVGVAAIGVGMAASAFSAAGAAAGPASGLDALPAPPGGGGGGGGGWTSFDTPSKAPPVPPPAASPNLLVTTTPGADARALRSLDAGGPGPGAPSRLFQGSGEPPGPPAAPAATAVDGWASFGDTPAKPAVPKELSADLFTMTAEDMVPKPPPGAPGGYGQPYAPSGAPNYAPPQHGMGHAMHPQPPGAAPAYVPQQPTQNMFAGANAFNAPGGPAPSGAYPPQAAHHQPPPPATGFNAFGNGAGANGQGVAMGMAAAAPGAANGGGMAAPEQPDPFASFLPPKMQARSRGNSLNEGPPQAAGQPPVAPPPNPTPNLFAPQPGYGPPAAGGPARDRAFSTGNPFA